MVRKLFLIVFIALILVSVASAQTIHQYNSLTLEETILSTLGINPTSESYSIRDVKMSLSLFPQNDFQQHINTFMTNPVATQKNNAIEFYWKEPTKTNLTGILQSQLTTTVQHNLVTQKTTYPLRSIPKDIQQYVQTTDNIDITPEIQNLANNLASNKKDLFLIEYELAEWVNQNIAYNLSTITVNANEPSSWVIKNKYGVCDEITNLFISLNRALGIPARFVSGIAYSEMIAGDNWGNHGWAEVYYPKIGWVPYDITYSQYGYVDPTHIALAKDIDGTKASINYESHGQGYDLGNNSLKFKTKILSQGELQKDRTTIKVNIKEPAVNTDSYNLITATITNLLDSYTVETLYLAKTNEITVFDPYTKQVVLKPHETKNVNWLIRINGDFKSSQYYIFPVSIETSTDNKAKTEFRVSEHDDHYSKSYMEQFLKQKKENPNQPITCTSKKRIMQTENVIITCNLKKESANNLPITLCLETKCQTINSTNNINNTIKFRIKDNKIGFRTKTISISTPKEQSELFITYEVSDNAKLEITNVSLPQEIPFQKEGNLNFFLEKDSFSSPTNITVFVSFASIQQSWSLNTLQEKQEFNLEIPGNYLSYGNNKFTIKVKYLDTLKKEQVVTKTIETRVSNSTTIDYLTIFTNTIQQKIIQLTTKKSENTFQTKSVSPLKGAILTGLFFLIILLVIKIIIQLISKLIKR